MTHSGPTLPPWAETMREVFRGGTVSQFLLHGNVFDFVPLDDGTSSRCETLSRFLTDVLFQPFDVVLFYNRGKGIRCAKGEKVFQEFLAGFDRFNQTTYATVPLSMPKDPRRALELLDRFLLYALHRLDVRAGALLRRARRRLLRALLLGRHAHAFRLRSSTSPSLRTTSSRCTSENSRICCRPMATCGMYFSM